MSASINTTKKSVGMEYMRAAAKYIRGGLVDYYSEAMPTTSSTIDDAKSTISEINSAFKSTYQSVFPKVKEFKMQRGLREISDWFLQKEKEFDDDNIAGGDIDLEFDDGTIANTGSAEIAELEINDADKNANKISKAIIESSHNTVKSQIELTANIADALSKQTATITTGFDKVNKTLEEILKVVTKNTAALIETTVASKGGGIESQVANKNNLSPQEKMMLEGKFNLSDYKKIMKGNFERSEFGMISAFLPMLMDPSMIKNLLTPETIVGGLVKEGIGKLAPNLKKNMKTLDDIVNDTIMSSLIRLGESNSFNMKGSIARIFGIDPSRQQTDTSRSSLELKSVPFDTVTREAITNAIPGYLRKILVAVGGEDAVYDYRSRSFRTKAALTKEFRNISANTGTLYGASKDVRNAVRGDNVIDRAAYDLMMTDLAGKFSGGEARRIVGNFKDTKSTEKYIQSLFGNSKLSKDELKAITSLANRLGGMDVYGQQSLLGQASRQSVNRNVRMQKYADEADKYEVDFSFIRDSIEDDLKHIKEAYGFGETKKNSNISSSGSNNNLFGLDYTNAALFAIFKRLDKGINVFQVGSNGSQTKRFRSFGDKYLKAPGSYKVTEIVDVQGDDNSNIRSSSSNKYDDGTNLLQNNTLDDGTTEDLTRGQRVGRWAKQRGGNFANAMFNGSPEDVKDAFGVIIKDISMVAGDQIKEGMSKVNTQFGNVSGHLKHQMFGTGYSYQEVDASGKPVTKTVADNKKGGIFGWFSDNLKESFKNSEEKGKNWFSEVAGYFDYSDPDDKDAKTTASKRKRLLAASVGAFAGAGLLGGPVGLILGAVAGNALESAGIGSKIKEMLFGKGDKDKGKKPGLLTRAVDKFVDPIKFQIHKSMSHFGSILKKNIFGPLSDLGFAIKDRVSSEVSSVFGKFFKGVFKVLGAPAKFAGWLGTKLFGGSVALAGGATRGVASGYTGMLGGVLNIGSSIIATKEGRSKIRERRAERNAKIDEEMKANKALTREEWKKLEDAKREERLSKLSEYTAEVQEKVEDNTSKISDTVEKIYDAMTGRSSISGMADDEELKANLGNKYNNRVVSMNGKLYHVDKENNRLVEVSMTGSGSGPEHEQGKSAAEISKKRDEARGDEEFANAIAGASVSVATGNGEITSEESKDIQDTVEEAAKPNSNKSTILSKFKNVVKRQGKKGEEQKEEKESFFSKLLKGIGGITSKIGGLGAIIAGIVGVSDLKTLWKEVIKGDMNFSEWWGEKSNIGKAIRGLMNISTVVGQIGAPIVNAGSSIIGWVTEKVPGIPKIDIPKIDATGPFAGLATGLLGGLYLRGITAAANLGQLALKAVDTGTNVASNLLNLGSKGSGGKLSTILKAGSVALAGYSYLKGPETYDNTTAGGDEIVNEGKTRAMRMPGTRVAIGAGIKSLANGVTNIGGKKAMESLAEAGITTTINKAGKLTFREGGKFATNAAIENATGMTKDAVVSAVGKTLTNTSEKAADSGMVKKLITKCLNAIKDFLCKNKHFAKFASIISSKIDDILLRIAKGVDGIVAKMPQKITSIITKGGTKDATGAVTAGIGYAVMAFGGALSGGLSAANIFGVREADVDGKMRTIASVVVAMLNGVPGLWMLELIDLVMIPVMGMSFRQWVCQLLYNLLGGTDDLAEKQATFGEDLKAYNETYGASLSTEEYNDMVNKGIGGKIFGFGAVKTDADGKAMFDEAGNVIRTNHGIAGWFHNSNKVYAHDENGNVLRDENGKAIQARDKYGRKKYETTRVGDAVVHGIGNLGGFLFGRKVYKTDEEGNAIVDPETGKLVEDHKEDNILKKGWKFLTSPFTKKDKEKDKDTEIKDSDGKPIIDAKGKAVKKSGLEDYMKSSMDSISSNLLHPFKSASNALYEFNKSNYLLDADGKPIKDANGKPIRKDQLDKFFKTSIGNMNSMMAPNFYTMSNTLGTGGPTMAAASAVTGFGTNASSNSNRSMLSGTMGKFIGTQLAASGQKLGISDGTDYEGGNPLNKAFRITSGFKDTQNRPHGGTHWGIDLNPEDGSTDAEVGSRYSGTITEVKSNVPDSVTAKKDGEGNWSFDGSAEDQTGNMVSITTDDGLTIKNMHLKAGSIPSNIKVGERINIGDKIGEMGSTGWSTGPHLHYEFRDENNDALDPTSSLSNIATMNKFNTSTNDTLGVDDDYGSTSGSSYSDSSISEEGTSGGGLMQQLLSAIKTAGSKFLFNITGGLLGSDGSSNAEVSDSSYSSGTHGGGGASRGYDPSVDYTNRPNSNWLQIVRDVKKLVAEQHPGYSQTSWIKITYNGKTLSVRTDCTGIICAMLKYYGVMPDNGNINSSGLLKDGAISDGFDKMPWPGWDKLVEGDIMATSGHAEIFAYNENGKHYVYNGGGTNSLGSPGPTITGHNAGYDVVWRCREEASLSSTGPTSVIESGSEEGIWGYLKKQGYSDYAAAGIMGNLYAESGLRSNNMQDSYEGAKYGNDESYTANVDSGAYTNFGSDSVGYGLAQWTYSSRKKGLLDFAKSKGRSIADTGMQMDYLMKEFNSNYSGVNSKLKSAQSVQDASNVMLYDFEKPASASSKEGTRAGYSQSYYDKYAGKNVSDISLISSSNTDDSSKYTDAVGGPEEDITSSIGASSFLSKALTNASSTVRNKTSSNIVSFPSTKSNNNNASNVGAGEAMGDLPSDGSSGMTDQIIALLSQVIQQLEAINGNTGTSNDLLGALNEKEFVDKGLRESLSSVGKSAGKVNNKSTTKYAQYNSGNTRMVSGLARPR